MSVSDRFWSKVDKSAGPDGCWIWTGASMRHGYGQLWCEGKVHLAHRVSWLIHHGELPKTCVLHRCDDGRCVNPQHLWLGTQAENLRDMATKGRAGRRVHGDDVVLEIKRLLVQGWRGVDIARHLGVSHPFVSAVKVGRSRSWVT